MLDKQLQSDLIGRLLAVRHARSQDTSTNSAKSCAKTNFHAVRSEAAKALAKIGEPEARAELITSSGGQRTRDAQAVVQALAASNTPESRETLWKMAQSEKNPEILATIVETWGARPGEPTVAKALKQHLRRSSFNSSLELAAIRSLRAQDDESAVPEVLARLQSTS
jgi:aminopeptidase N